MAERERKEPKVDIVVSPVYEVLMGLSELACASDHHHHSLPEFVRKAHSSLRPRLLTNLQRYFDDASYPGMGLLSLVGENFTQDVATFLQALARLPDTDLATALLSFGKIYRGTIRSERPVEELLADPALLAQHIEKNMSVGPEKIPELVEIVTHPAAAREDLAELIEHFWYVLMPPEVEKRLQQQQQVAEQMQARVDEFGAVRVVTALTNLYLLSEDNTYEQVILAPSSFAGKRIVATDNREETALVVMFGDKNRAFDTLKPEAKDGEPLDAETLAKVYSVLSDKTRLEILKALTERPHYGQELAQMLGISNATVFHHLSIFDKIKIVHLERIEHRVYYVLDTGRLGQLLTQGNSFLLG